MSLFSPKSIQNKNKLSRDYKQKITVDHQQTIGDTLYFHGGKSVFSNFHNSDILVDIPLEVHPKKNKHVHLKNNKVPKLKLLNSETLYQFRKSWAFNDKDKCIDILEADSAKQTKKISHNIKGHDSGKEKWHSELAVGVMCECVYRKFSENDPLKHDLMNAPPNLVEASSSDFFWGSGSSEPGTTKGGQNMLGKILQALREFFSNGEKSSDEYKFKEIKEHIERNDVESFQVTFK